MTIKQKTQRDLLNAKYRLMGQVYEALLDTYARRRETDGINRKQIAECWRKDQGQVTRIFKSPRNLTLETVAEILEILDAELAVNVIDLRNATAPSISTFGDRATSQNKPADVGSKATSGSFA